MGKTVHHTNFYEASSLSKFSTVDCGSDGITICYKIDLDMYQLQDWAKVSGMNIAKKTNSTYTFVIWLERHVSDKVSERWGFKLSDHVHILLLFGNLQRRKFNTKP